MTTGDENTPAMVARSGLNTPPQPHNRASVQSNALVTHPITDILDGTLWNRDLGSASEDIVGTLVAQLFTGIRDYIVQVCKIKGFFFFTVFSPLCTLWPLVRDLMLLMVATCVLHYSREVSGLRRSAGGGNEVQLLLSNAGDRRVPHEAARGAGDCV